MQGSFNCISTVRSPASTRGDSVTTVASAIAATDGFKSSCTNPTTMNVVRTADIAAERIVETADCVSEGQR